MRVSMLSIAAISTVSCENYDGGPVGIETISADRLRGTVGAPLQGGRRRFRPQLRVQRTANAFRSGFLTGGGCV